MRLVFLGTGAAWGHPVMAKHNCKPCDYAVKNRGKDLRTRSAILLQVNGANVLIDAGTDIRSQLFRENINTNEIAALLITHGHTDHIGGLDELRPFLGVPVPPLDTYTSSVTWDEINKRFSYLIGGALKKDPKNPNDPSVLKPGQPVSLLSDKLIVTPFDVYHGPTPPSAMGFVFEAEGKKVAYSGDLYNFGRTINTNRNPETDPIPDIFKGSDVLIMEVNWFNEPFRQPWNPHMSFQRALEYFQITGFLKSSTKVFLIHISHEDWAISENIDSAKMHDPLRGFQPLRWPPPLNHEEWQKAVSEEGRKLGIEINVAYDGLSVEV